MLVLPFVVGLLVDKGRVLLAKHPMAERKPYPGFFDLPGGKLEPDESVERCLCREIFEETGLRIRMFGPQPLAVFSHHPRTMLPECMVRTPSLGICFVVRKWVGTFSGAEMTDWNWFKLENINDLRLTPWARYFIARYNSLPRVERLCSNM